MGREEKDVVAFGSRPRTARLELPDLPDPDTRWVWRQKVKVVAAVNSGVLSLDEACRRYAMSVEEFRSWQETCFGSRQPARAAKGHRTFGKGSA